MLSSLKGNYSFSSLIYYFCWPATSKWRRNDLKPSVETTECGKLPHKIDWLDSNFNEKLKFNVIFCFICGLRLGLLSVCQPTSHSFRQSVWLSVTRATDSRICKHYTEQNYLFYVQKKTLFKLQIKNKKLDGQTVVPDWVPLRCSNYPPHISDLKEYHY